MPRRFPPGASTSGRTSPPTWSAFGAALRGIAAQYSRYDYRKVRIFLARQGCARHAMSADRVFRPWRRAGLQVPRRRPRRRVASSRPRPTAANHVWAYDFIFDTCADGRALKRLTIVDEYTRECLAIDVAGSIRSGRVSGAPTRSS